MRILAPMIMIGSAAAIAAAGMILLASPPAEVPEPAANQVATPSTVVERDVIAVVEPAPDAELLQRLAERAAEVADEINGISGINDAPPEQIDLAANLNDTGDVGALIEELATEALGAVEEAVTEEVTPGEPVEAVEAVEGTDAVGGVPVPVLRPASAGGPGLGYAADPLEDMIGQMIMIGFDGTSRDDTWPRLIVSQIASGQIGGVMFNQKNAVSRTAVQAMTGEFRAAAGDRPLLVALDQEGGRVERLTARAGFNEIAAPAEVARTMSPEAAEQLYTDLAANLKAWGFNFNLGPVLDVNVNPNNPIIGRLGRSFSADPSVVTRFGAAFIAGHRRANVLTAAKHFPGHGSSTGDTHAGFVDISNTWSSAELQPYRDLIAQGALDTVMLGHVSLAELSTSQRQPATFSAKVTSVLRNDLGFSGVIISDDMEMNAIAANYSFEDALLAAVRAGNDILIYSNFQDPRPQLPPRIIATLKQEALRDPAFRALIEAAFGRITTLKQRLGYVRPVGTSHAEAPAAPATRSFAPAEPKVAARFVVPDLDGL